MLNAYQQYALHTDNLSGTTIDTKKGGGSCSHIFLITNAELIICEGNFN